MPFISWLASRFARIIKHTSPKTHMTGTQKQSIAQPAPVAPVASLSADFHFAATLLGPLLLHLQRMDASPHTKVVVPLTEGTASAGQAASKKAGTRARKGSKVSRQSVNEAHAQPLAWHMAAKGAALLVRPRRRPISACVPALSMLMPCSKSCHTHHTAAVVCLHEHSITSDPAICFQ